jgi:hypothetical protein
MTAYNEEVEKKENWIMNMRILDEIRSKYRPLLKIIENTYTVKVCFHCSGQKMEFSNVSSTGQSITCKCVNCSKEQKFTILPKKSGSEVVERLNEIKQLMGSFRKPVDDNFWKEDVDTTFIVGIINNSEEHSSGSSFVELAYSSLDQETGEGDLLTTPSHSPFISENEKYTIEEFCMIVGLRSDEQTQKFFCLKVNNEGIGNFQNNKVGIIIKTIEGIKIDFSAFGNIENGDVPYTCFSPINLQNPDIDVKIEGFSISTSSPQDGIDKKWEILETIPIDRIQTHGSEGVQNFVPNPDFTDFPAQNLFIEHLKALK